MAVYQISRIQIRRGKANELPIPQLASGEMAWAVDTQQLFIGNGSVAEGSPAVGNTRVLTEVDLTSTGNLLNIAEYSYKNSTSYPSRTIQSRLDDQVTSLDFGVVGNGVADDTITLQYAIDQLFLNQNDPAFASGGEDNRVTLVLPAGIFLITGTIYIPSYTTLVGAGVDKTIIYFNPANNYAGPAFQTVNDNSTPGNPSDITTTQVSNQPRNITITGMTVHATTGANVCLKLDATRDSVFSDLKLQGDWVGYGSSSFGVHMVALSTSTGGGDYGKPYQAEGQITCQNLVFENVEFYKFYYGAYAKGDVIKNTFKSCRFNNVNFGVALGIGSNGASQGERFGPRYTQIIDCEFFNVKRQAVHIYRGDFNLVDGARLINVGNEGSGNISGAHHYPQVYFNTSNNTMVNTQSDRSADLATDNWAVPYVAELGGYGKYQSHGVRRLVMNNNNLRMVLFRLPVSCDSDGAPIGSIRYTVDYFYKSTMSLNNGFTRAGSINIVADINSKHVNMSDEYDYAGADPENTQALMLDFSIGFLDANGATYTGAVGQVPTAIALYYLDTLGGDVGYIEYSYTQLV